MFCPNCGSKIEKGDQFCQNCGTKVENFIKKEKNKISNNAINKSPVLDNPLFYTEDWIRTKYFAISSFPHFDILITKDNLYLLRLPRTHDGTLGLFLGLILFSIIGAIIGATIGNLNYRNRRKKHRAAWVNSDHKLISQEYENSVFLKIPRNKLKNILSFEKNKLVVIASGDKIITLKKNKNEYERFARFIESYVL